MILEWFRTVFRSHMITMIVFASIISVMMAFLRYDEKKEIMKYGIRLFLYMVGSVVVISWVMFFL